MRHPQVLGAIVVLSYLFVAVEGFADGKGFSTLAEDSVQTADQRAVIVWKEGREKLVIETGLESKSDGVAWVIPVPAVPEVKPATRGLFPTLERCFAPRLNVGPEYRPLFLILLALVVLFALRTARLIEPGTFVALCFAWLLFSFVGVSALSSAGAGISSSEIEIHERQTVGNYQVATIEGESPDALLTWLTENGYRTSQSAGPVIADYVKSGWVFVAAKLRRGEGTSRRLNPHPLELDFQTDRCVYPMRLTGVGQKKPVTVELFVFAGQQAKASGFHTRSVLRAQRPALTSNPHFRYRPQLGDRVSVRHPYLTGLVGLDPLGECVATRLRGTLTPNHMNRDLVLRFNSAEFYREQRYTIGAIFEYSLIAALCILGSGILVSSIVSRIRRQPRFLLRSIPWLVLIALVGQVGAFCYFSFTGKEGREASEGARVLYDIRHGLRVVLLEAEATADPETIDPAWVRKVIQDGWEDLFREESEMTPIPRELDAPGQYTIEPAEEGLKVFTYDHAGSRHLIWTSATSK